MDETVILFRPVGGKELELIRKAGSREFPPRLPDQPIFYPVTSQEYARQIARDWNAKFNDDKAGYVTRFAVRKSYIGRYETRVVGGSEHEEYWIPAEDLTEFNQNIVGTIEVIEEFFGNE